MATKKNPVVHFEMPYQDSERVSKFYAAAFGWEMNNLGAEMGDYVMATTTEIDKDNMILTPGNINGGFFAVEADGLDQHPSVVIEVDNILEAMKRVRDAGGQVLGEPMEIPGIGQYVACIDTEGNKLSIMQPIMPG